MGFIARTFRTTSLESELRKRAIVKKRLAMAREGKVEQAKKSAGSAFSSFRDYATNFSKGQSDPFGFAPKSTTQPAPRIKKRMHRRKHKRKKIRYKTVRVRI